MASLPLSLFSLTAVDHLHPWSGLVHSAVAVDLTTLIRSAAVSEEGALPGVAHRGVPKMVCTAKLGFQKCEVKLGGSWAVSGRFQGYWGVGGGLLITVNNSVIRVTVNNNL